MPFKEMPKIIKKKKKNLMKVKNQAAAAIQSGEK